MENKKNTEDNLEKENIDKLEIEKLENNDLNTESLSKEEIDEVDNSKKIEEDILEGEEELEEKELEEPTLKDETEEKKSSEEKENEEVEIEDETIFEKENNQNKKIEKKEVKGKFNIKGIIMLLFIITLVMGLPSFFSEAPSKDMKEISYSNFIGLVKEKTIVEVEEKEGYIYGSIEKKADKKVEKKEKASFFSSKKKKEPIKIETYKARMITDRLGSDLELVNLIKSEKIGIASVPPEELPFIVNLLIAWFPTLFLMAILFFIFSKMNKGNGGGGQIFNIGKSKIKEKTTDINEVTFKDVAGIDESKVELEEIVQFLKEPEKFKKIGAKIPKGVLLLGAPGTGKTLLAKAVAGEAGVPFLSMSGSEFVEMFVGVGASRVRDLFAKARKSAPCIVFIDEIDAVGRKRGSGQGGGNDEREQTLNQLLVEMDGFGNDETVIILAATNRPEVLDRALMRPGRFDRQVVVDAPDIKGRIQILEVHSRNKKLSEDVKLEVVARKTPGFVGADLANLLNEAAILAAREGRDEINMGDLEEASEKVSIGPERKSRVTVEKERLIVAYHEVGHALTQTILPYCDPVHKVTIIPRGSAALGYTMSLPTEDRYLKSKKEYLSEIRVLLGGRAAEKIVFDDITTGAGNDIQRATGIAHAIVTKFGMSDKFGPILLDSTVEGDMFAQKHYSEITGKEIDDEIRSIISEAYNDVQKLLIDNAGILEYITQTLLVRETITGEELKILMTGEQLSDGKIYEKKISNEISEPEIINVDSDEIEKTII